MSNKNRQSKPVGIRSITGKQTKPTTLNQPTCSVDKTDEIATGGMGWQGPVEAMLQLEYCGFTCEGGKLENSAAFQYLQGYINGMHKASHDPQTMVHQFLSMLDNIDPQKQNDVLSAVLRDRWHRRDEERKLLNERFAIASEVQTELEGILSGMVLKTSPAMNGVPHMK